MIKGVTAVGYDVKDPHSLFGFGLDVVSITQNGETGLKVTFKNLALPDSKYGGRGTYDKKVHVSRSGTPEQVLPLPTQPEFALMETRSYDVDLTQFLDDPGIVSVLVETLIGTQQRSSFRTVTLSIGYV